jgi:hypothetical protein
MTTADAVDREVAWLTSSGDSLPALLASAGGPFTNIQAYWPRTPGRRNTNLYLLRRGIHQKRFANVRTMATHHFTARIVWPLQSGQGKAENDQRALDAAIDLLLQRIAGYPGDKTHGGRFRSVAENPEYVSVQFTEPAQSMTSEAEFWADVDYYADDPETTD